MTGIARRAAMTVDKVCNYLIFNVVARRRKTSVKKFWTEIYLGTRGWLRLARAREHIA
jgi:hypothetical protein